MKTTIDVKSKAEAAQLKRAMDDPAVRAFALMMGVLLDLPTDKARRRVLQYVRDHLDDQPAPESANGPAQ